MSEKRIQEKMGELTPDALKVVQEKKTSGRLRLKKALDLLSELSTFDEILDQMRIKAGKRGNLMIILSAFGFFGTVALFIAFWPLGFVMLALTAVGVVMAIIFFKKRSRLKKVDLSNDFRSFLLPFLHSLAEDVHPEARLKMELDLSGPTSDKVIQEGEIPPGRFRKVVETIYEDPWCRLEVPLFEGSRLLLTVENKFISHDRYWRNPRGKSKHKQKWKKLAYVSTGLIPNSDIYGIKSSGAESEDSLKLKLTGKNDQDIARIRRKFKFKAVNETPEESPPAEEVIGMVFQLGALLQPGQAEAQ